MLLLELLPWLHPALVLVAIACTLPALRLGLRMRTSRLRATPRPKAWWHRHLRWGRVALWTGGVGAVLGPLTWVLWREEALLSTLHGRVGTVTAVLAALTGLFGRQVALGRPRWRPAHGLVAVLALMGALVALLTGLELLP